MLTGFRTKPMHFCCIIFCTMATIMSQYAPLPNSLSDPIFVWPLPVCQRCRSLLLSIRCGAAALIMMHWLHDRCSSGSFDECLCGEVQNQGQAVSLSVLRWMHWLGTDLRARLRSFEVACFKNKVVNYRNKMCAFWPWLTFFIDLIGRPVSIVQRERH